MKNLLIAFLLLFSNLATTAQEITETNTDILYKEGLQAYQNGDFKKSLTYTRQGLSLAPLYHDIRILQVRNLWALEKYAEADKDLQYLLEIAPDYIDVKPLALQRLKNFASTLEVLTFLEQLEKVYPEDKSLQIRKAQLLLKDGQPRMARNLANKLISSSDLTGDQRYALQLVLNRTVTQQIGAAYQQISFSEEYARKAWHNGSLEYQHNFNKTAVIGRINYSNRSYDQSYMYELEAYPVFSDRFYAYTNVGLSEGTLFPDFRSSLSLYYNFASVFEGEAGGRLLTFQDRSYFSGILGLSLYQGKFLFNLRTFLGPERQGQLVQNYQGNVRYYLSLAENYLFARVGSGISPDERFRYSQIQENPTLKAFYSSLGIKHLFWSHHIIQLEAGLLFEDITTDRSGSQFHLGLGYKVRL